MLTWFLTKLLWLPVNVKFKTNLINKTRFRALKSALSKGDALI